MQQPILPQKEGNVNIPDPQMLYDSVLNAFAPRENAVLPFRCASSQWNGVWKTQNSHSHPFAGKPSHVAHNGSC